jgi:hypothetical protein
LEGLYMGAVRDFDEVLERYHQALGEFAKGNPEPIQRLHSHRGDVTIANPRGGIGHGWAQVAERLSDAASGRQGAELRFEVIEKLVTFELAYIVEMEWAEAKFAGKEKVSSYGLAGYRNFSTRRRHLEGGASARPDDLCSARGAVRG